MRIEVRHFFSAAHQLPDSEHLITKECARLHGHTYCVVVDTIGDNVRAGMVVDFKGVKQVVDVLDHEYINKVWEGLDGWSGVPTTAENIAKFIKERLNETYPDLTFVIALAEGYKGEGNTSWVTV